MIAPRVISLDLDDTSVAGGAGHRRGGKRLVRLAQVALSAGGGRPQHRVHASLRAGIAAQFPDTAMICTFLRRSALAAQFAAAGLSRNRWPTRRWKCFSPSAIASNVYADVRPSLARLRTRYRLFAVSNGNADLQRCGIGDLFDGHVTAAPRAPPSPMRASSRSCGAIAGVSAAEVLHVGDDPLADVVGARAGGHAGGVAQSRGARWPDEFAPPPRTISTLAEIT